MKTKVSEKNRRELLKKMESYKKLDYKQMEEETYEVKQYLKELTLPEARMKFSLRSMTTKTVKYHYMNDKAYKADMWSCISCKKIDSIGHIKVCPLYEHLRQGKDLKDDKDKPSHVFVVMVVECCPY